MSKPAKKSQVKDEEDPWVLTSADTQKPDSIVSVQEEMKGEDTIKIFLNLSKTFKFMLQCTSLDPSLDNMIFS